MLEELLKYFIPILVSVLAGGLIGIEREYRDKSAGFRTMILIAIGSTLFTLLSIKMGTVEKESTRIAAAIVTGIGFLGAGVVLKDGATIRGITTAASIWLVAALGMGAGLMEYELVGAVTLLVLIVLWALPPFERWIDRMHDFVEVDVTIKNSDEDEDNILDIFDECKIKIVQITRSRLVKGERVLHIKANTTAKKQKALSEILVNEKGVLKFTA
ncbi:MgtC/SapB family protein [Candidatus Nomurabacteria bacterium]|nr:MgtC/SapB family protein [Candidatus Nomurabacteria bacterium]